MWMSLEPSLLRLAARHVSSRYGVVGTTPQLADGAELRERGGDLVEARLAEGLDDHHVADGEMAAQPVDGRVGHTSAYGRQAARTLRFRCQQTLNPRV